MAFLEGTTIRTIRLPTLGVSTRSESPIVHSRLKGGFPTPTNRLKRSPASGAGDTRCQRPRVPGHRTAHCAPPGHRIGHSGDERRSAWARGAVPPEPGLAHTCAGGPWAHAKTV